jgi:hypothetical protein
MGMTAQGFLSVMVGAAIWSAVFILPGHGPAHAQAPVAIPAPLGGGRAIGQVTGLTGSTLQLTLRTGRIIVINLRAALASHLVPRIVKGEFLMVQGKPEGAGRMDALAIVRAKSAPAAWPPDIL